MNARWRKFSILSKLEAETMEIGFAFIQPSSHEWSVSLSPPRTPIADQLLTELQETSVDEISTVLAVLIASFHGIETTCLWKEQQIPKTNQRNQVYISTIYLCMQNYANIDLVPFLESAEINQFHGFRMVSKPKSMHPGNEVAPRSKDILSEHCEFESWQRIHTTDAMKFPANEWLYWNNHCRPQLAELCHSTNLAPTIQKKRSQHRHWRATSVNWRHFFKLKSSNNLVFVLQCIQQLKQKTSSLMISVSYHLTWKTPQASQRARSGCLPRNLTNDLSYPLIHKWWHV